MTTRKPAARIAAAALAWLALAAFGGLEATLAPEADLWRRWTAHDPNSTAAIDHAAWDAFLAAYRRPGRGGDAARVAYAAVTAADRERLAGYIAAMAAQPIGQFNRDEQLAYWINLYNALTVKVVLDHWPVASILDIDISPGLFSSGPWGAPAVTVDGETLTLNDIEHRILRPIWKDPRVHYAVNCASVGCPDLAGRAYRAKGMTAMLDAAARAYVNSPRGARFDADGRLIVSKIYSWFVDDFGGSAASVLAHLRRYADAGLRRRLATIKDIEATAYDWTVNAAPAE